MSEPKNYVILGGTSGIGEALVKLLAQEGHQVFVYARNIRNVQVSSQIHFNEADVSQEFSLAGLPEVIHGLAYCPGSITLQPFHRIKTEQFQSDFQLNVMGAISAIQQCLSGLKASGSAAVVLFSTVAVQTGMSFHTSVAVSKGAVEGLTRALAAEYASSRIRINCIAPSLTETPLAEKLLNTIEKKEAGAKRHPLGRIGQAEDSARVAQFLLNENEGWITGQILGVDGGMGSLRLI
ncbi:MAG TPA: SDR family oxidoreductase [Flavobacteriales bacterium]|nr:SDR family oxidoreductase [Flavobacteriales bacterium]HPH81203.1 SDR family oxidoreductase [Flavobacteriales bacterium]